MDKDTKSEFEKRDVVMEGLRENLDSLTNSFAAFKSETEGKITTMQDSLSSRPDSPGISSDPDAPQLHDSADAAALQDQVAHLQERNAYLESEDYQTDVIEDFLRKLTADGFNNIGLRLGFLETTEPSEEELAALGEGKVVEVPLEDGKTLLMTAVKPADSESWEFSENHKLYIKIL